MTSYRFSPSMEPIYLQRLVVENIRCFETIDIDFTDQGRPCPWTLLLGDNGSGKSTLLKCIALALAPLPEAGPLFSKGGSWLRAGATEGRIRLETSRDGVSQLRVASFTRGGEQLVTEQDLEEIPLVCGYGASRRSFGTTSPHSFSAQAAVATLFEPDAPLQNPELAVRRLLSGSGTGVEALLGCIERAMNLPPESLRLGQGGLEVRGPWGGFLPIAALSDGYRSTLSWLFDFIGWALMAAGDSPGWGDQTPPGVVLLDEIEQHLHPRWQRRILGSLREQLPRVQFVATTHAPLCVTGTTDLPDDDVNLFYVGWQGSSVQVSPPIKPPRGQRADQVLTSFLFGLETTSDDKTKAQIERLSTLLSRGDSLEEHERQEVETLRGELGSSLAPAETATEALVKEAVDQALDQRLEGHLESLSAEASSGVATGVDPEVARFEALRRLQEVLR